MASWIDVFSLVMTTLCFVGVILGVIYAVRAISSSLQSTKASLAQRGITLSSQGVSVKTEKRFDRESYLDATQRGFVKVLGAAKVGPESQQRTLLPEGGHRKMLLDQLGIAFRRSRSSSSDECSDECSEEEEED